MVGMENFIPDGWDQLVDNIYGVLRAASRPKRCCISLPISKDSVHVTNLGPEDSWEGQVPVR